MLKTQRFSLQIQGKFSGLYKERKSSDEAADFFLSNSDISKLDEDAKRICEGRLSVCECYNALLSMSDNKTPGNDGLPSEFYKRLWPLLGKQLVECLNYAFENGHLSNSQMQAVITLLQKKDRDKRFVKNWRPISLINVDAKIGAKSLARRLCKVLPNIIHSDQCAYVKDRLISDAIRTIDDIMWYTRSRGIEGMLVAIDFEKAFDSVDLKFLMRVLEVFNFGPGFIQSIKTFYNGAKSCVINNGYTSHYFDLGRGVRQGDPLSAYLFITVIEVLLINIRGNRSIRGIPINGKEIKLTSFADDVTTFLKDLVSFHNLMKMLDQFGNCAGLKLNKSKTEALWLGPPKSIDLHDILKLTNTYQPPKILGIFFTYDEKLRDTLNFAATLESVKKLLAQWRRRGLTLIGKIQVLKSLIIPKFLYRLTNISCEDEIIKEINKVMYSYIWNGKDKIKRLAIINDIENGGLRMTHLESAIQAQRLMTLKRYVSNRDPSWTHILDSCLKEVGGRFLLRCNFDVSKLPVKIPAFYKDCLVSWSSLVKWTNETMDGVLEQTIWNNKFILIENKSVYYSSFISIGLVTIGDMLSRTGSFLGFDKLRQKGVTPSEYLQWLGLVHSLPPEWHLLMKNVNSLPSCFTAIENKNLENVRVFLDGHSVDVKQLTSKKVYGSFIASRAKEPSSKVRFIEHFSDENLDWKTIYKIPFVSTIDTRTRIFQFRILHRILYTNSTL